MGCVGTEEETEVVVVVWSLFGADVEVIETWDDLVVSWATLAASGLTTVVLLFAGAAFAGVSSSLWARFTKLDEKQENRENVMGST